jgi:hypothetical protein
MKNLVIEKGIAFHSMEYSDSMEIDKLKINLTSVGVKLIS